MPLNDPPSDSYEKLLTPAQVAQMFRVDPKTVTRWAKDGKLSTLRTLGGHRRYFRNEVVALLGYDTMPSVPNPHIAKLEAELDELAAFVERRGGRKADKTVARNRIKDITAELEELNQS